MAGWRGPVFASLALLGCSIGELDIAGKRCPCPEPEWVCDPESNTCTQGETCTPRFTVADFHSAWTTTHNIRWEWEPVGDADSFGSYEIQISRTREEMEAGTALRFDRETYAELGRFSLLNTGDPDENVRAAVIYGLEPNAPWFGRLIATDAFGCPYRSPIVPATTLPQSTHPPVVLFEDTAPLPEQLFTPNAPGAFRYNADCAGNPCLEYLRPPNANETNLRLNVSIPASAFEQMSPGQFENLAILEFRIWNEDPSQSFWTNIWLAALPAGEVFNFEPYSPVTTPPAPVQASYWTVQVPLRELVRLTQGTNFTWAELTAVGVSQFNYGGAVPPGKRIWLDDIRIRW